MLPWTGRGGRQRARSSKNLSMLPLGLRFRTDTAEAAALVRQPIEMLAGLNSLGGRMQAEAMPQPYDCVDDFGISRAGGQRLMRIWGSGSTTVGGADAKLVARRIEAGGNAKLTVSSDDVDQMKKAVSSLRLSR